LDDDEFNEEIYEPVGNPSDTDVDVRVSSIQLSVVRCLHVASRDEDWCRSSFTHMPYMRARVTS